MTPPKPGGFTSVQMAQLKDAIASGVREAFSDAGLRIDSDDHEDEARADFIFLRLMRKRFNGASTLVGSAIIISVVSGIGWLLYQGANFWRGHP